MDYGIGPPRHTDILEAGGHLGTTGKSIGVYFEGGGHGYMDMFVSSWPFLLFGSGPALCVYLLDTIPCITTMLDSATTWCV